MNERWLTSWWCPLVCLLSAYSECPLSFLDDQDHWQSNANEPGLDLEPKQQQSLWDNHIHFIWQTWLKFGNESFWECGSNKDWHYWAMEQIMWKHLLKKSSHWLMITWSTVVFTLQQDLILLLLVYIWYPNTQQILISRLSKILHSEFDKSKYRHYTGATCTSQKWLRGFAFKSNARYVQFASLCSKQRPGSKS